jgi:hypothetical protein
MIGPSLITDAPWAYRGFLRPPMARVAGLSKERLLIGIVAAIS